MPLGILTLNQAAEIFNLAPFEGGDTRVRTLNVVDASIANEYQMNKVKNGKNSEGNPVPDPEENESKDEYISKVISLLTSEGMDAGQAYKVAIDKWNELKGGGEPDE